MFKIFKSKKMVKKQNITMVSGHQLAPANWSNRNLRVYTDEGYKINNIVYKCIRVLSDAGSGIPLKVKVNGEFEPDHPLQKLIDEPNPISDKQNFVQSLIGFRKITGNSYAEVITNSVGEPIQLWSWPSYNMKVLINKRDRIPKKYVYLETNGSVYKHEWDIDEITGQSDILHWKEYNPLSDYSGMSPIEAAAYSVDQHNAASAWNKRMLDNSCVPSGLIISEDEIDEEQYKQYQKILSENFEGPANARKFMILGGGAKWQSIAHTAAEMDWLEGKNQSARDIATVFSVPNQIVGITGDQTFANYEQARLSLYEDTIIPLMNDLAHDLTRWLGWRYQDNPKIVISIDDIPALSSKRAEKLKSLKEIDYMTINEKRIAAGLEPLDDPSANQIWMGSAMLPIAMNNQANKSQVVSGYLNNLRAR